MGKLPVGEESKVTVRPATLDDLALLRHWDEQAHVIASDPNDDWNWAVELGRHPDWREQLIAEVHGRAVAFVQIIDPAREESHYWGEAPLTYARSTSGLGRLRTWEKDMVRESCSSCSTGVSPLQRLLQCCSIRSRAMSVRIVSTSDSDFERWSTDALARTSVSYMS